MKGEGVCVFEGRMSVEKVGPLQLVTDTWEGNLGRNCELWKVIVGDEGQITSIVKE